MYDITQSLLSNPLVRDVSAAAEELDRAVEAQANVYRTAWNITDDFTARKTICNADKRVKNAQALLRKAQRALQLRG